MRDYELFYEIEEMENYIYHLEKEKMDIMFHNGAIANKLKNKNDKIKKQNIKLKELQFQFNQQKAMWNELKEYLINTLKEKQNSPKYYKLNEVLEKNARTRTRREKC